MNATIRNFGYPATLVREWDHWTALLRPAQPTLGSLILAARSEARAFADLSSEAFAELPQVVGVVEKALQKLISYEKINYLMLMMVDPHVHLHVIPRYDGIRSAPGGPAIVDTGWPKVPALSDATTLSDTQVRAMTAWMKPAFEG
ncbi:HIT family protein [Pacificimonas flava]|uniref:HIT domain-containing protein n=1 Tax=Pacificimonas flava TaxID=1234595 RepID=M2U1E0_9SPHN|nr:HIT family protein [Pacificimonas flava]EMD81812.1 hypothetical protein C725_2794 [Pacificimonas flava]MBB5281657.1 diadenosine tetraphosphate (Ap4A) HIT family hydrolase [Pacificimonas flava]